MTTMARALTEEETSTEEQQQNVTTDTTPPPSEVTPPTHVGVREVQGWERGAGTPPHVRARPGGDRREEERLESDEE